MGFFHDFDPKKLKGTWAKEQEARLPEDRYREEVARALAFGLEAAEEVEDRRIVRLVASAGVNFPTLPVSTPSLKSLTWKMYGK
ncbi:hypothetical protein [Thermus antranikianii]|uniref:hypothetical protein n=1 Tax=Thermus antranikianii TaxID=88190 RepID=UPI001C76861E|nr:hypothetical protein [Thermus antranikianii]QWK21060.1 MAG: hypothetical protein KNN15_08365 [Thermus antranikianii]